MMKKARRILAFVLTVMMLATCMAPVVFADETAAISADKQNAFSDVNADAVYVPAVKTLNLMGIINGYPDGTFGPEKNVTRAEFTAMLMRTLNLGGIGAKTAANLPFTDVDDNDSGINWAIPDINTAYAKKIINGYEDQTFRPNANVSYEEALKMIVATLGYSLDVSGTPWYGEYVAQAGRLGITDVAYTLGKVETPATRACIAQMLYDTLEVNLVEKDEVTKKTILTDYLGYQKGRGRIASNGDSSLMAPDVLLRDNEVQIMELNSNAGYTYRVTEDDVKNYLGHEIEYYYKENGDGSRDLVLYVVQNSNELVIDADTIEPSSSNNAQIRYYSENSQGRTTVANLAADSIVLYNGKLYGPTTAASRFDVSMIPQVGSVKLLDANLDGRYDVINIESYVVYYVSSKVSSEYSIIDDLTKVGGDKKLILNVNDNSKKTSIVNTNGSEMDYSSIGVGNIICLAESNAANGGEILRKAVVVSDSVSGTITSFESGSSITIGSTKYSYSKAAPWMNGLSSIMPEPQIQESGTYYKDINGDIVAYKKNATVENVYYGYIMGMRDSDSAFDETKEVRILNQNGNVSTVLLTNDVKIYDGNTISVSSVAEAEARLEAAAAAQNKDSHGGTASVHQVVKYTTRNTAKGTILDKVYVAESVNAGATAQNDKLYFYNAVNGAMEVTYNSASKQLTTAGGVGLGINGATVFVVPSNRGSYEDYAKKSVSDVFKNKQKYFVEAYDVSKTNNAKIVVCYGGSAASEVDNFTPVYVLSQNTERATNESNGDVMTRLTSLVSSGGAEKQSWLSPSSPWTPQLGDIYRPGTDKDGFTSIETEDVLYSVGRNNAYGVHSNNANEPFAADFTVVLGSVVAIDDTSFAVLPERVVEGQTGVDLTAALNFNFSSFNNARVFVYDETGSELVIKDMSADKDGILRGMVEYDAEGVTNPTKVLIHMVNGGIRMICVLDQNA